LNYEKYQGILKHTID
jgi:dynein heavy chain